MEGGSDGGGGADGEGGDDQVVTGRRQWLRRSRRAAGLSGAARSAVQQDRGGRGIREVNSGLEPALQHAQPRRRKGVAQVPSRLFRQRRHRALALPGPREHARCAAVGRPGRGCAARVSVAERLAARLWPVGGSSPRAALPGTAACRTSSFSWCGAKWGALTLGRRLRRSSQATTASPRADTRRSGARRRASSLLRRPREADGAAFPSRVWSALSTSTSSTACSV